MVLNADEVSHVAEVADVFHPIDLALSPTESLRTAGVWEIVKDAYDEAHEFASCRRQ